MVIRYDLPKNILVVTKGHPFDKAAFFGMLDALPGQGEAFTWTHVEHPAAIALFRPEEAARFDAFVLYDMPGIVFRNPDPPRFLDPPAGFMENLELLLEAGKPLLFLHHALAGWPASARYAEILGGRFLYQPGSLRGRTLPDSGYRHEVTHRLYPVADHPVTAGLEDGFAITDEVYLAEIFDDSVIPLMRSRFDFTAENFYSARLALAGTMFSNDGWRHAAGSNLVAWTRREKNSPIVYIQPGDGPSAYDNPGYRRLLGNAVNWLLGPDAAAFGRQQH
jgi:type 1 glutamine amidotransferase